MHHVSLTSRLHATSVSSCDIRMANTVVCVYANAQITKSRMLAARALRPDEIDTQSVIVAGGVAGSAYVLTSYPILRIIIYYTPYHYITCFVLFIIFFFLIKLFTPPPPTIISTLQSCILCSVIKSVRHFFYLPHD